MYHSRRKRPHSRRFGLQPGAKRGRRIRYHAAAPLWKGEPMMKLLRLLSAFDAAKRHTADDEL